MSNFTDFALNQDVMSFKDKLEAVIADKVGDALAQKKLEVAQTFFDAPVEVVEPAAEVAEKVEQVDERHFSSSEVKMAHTIGKEFEKKGVGQNPYAVASGMVKNNPAAAKKAYRTIKAKK